VKGRGHDSLLLYLRVPTTREPIEYRIDQNDTVRFDPREDR